MLVTGTRAAWLPGTNTLASETAMEDGLLPWKSGLWAPSRRARREQEPEEAGTEYQKDGVPCWGDSGDLGA